MRKHASLPEERVIQVRPFQVTGLDYSGALNVRDSVGNIVKVYIYCIIYVCCVARYTSRNSGQLFRVNLYVHLGAL